MWQELLDNMKLVGTFITGRLAIAGGVGLAVASGVATSFLPLIVVPLGAGLMAILTKMTYDHDNQHLTDFYRDEVAGKKGTQPRTVTVKQATEVAAENRVLKEAFERNNRKKMVAFLSHGAAALAVVGLALALTAAGAFLPGAVLASHVVAAVGGSLACFVMDSVFEKIGGKMFGLNKRTTHEGIRDLSRLKAQQGGKLVQAQVMSVFVQANPGLANDILARFGKEYDKLADNEIRRAVEEFGPRINLAQVTDDLNTNRVRITSLAFLAAGQEPGVARLKDAPLGKMDKAKLAAGKALETGKVKAAESFAKGKTAVSHTMDRVKLAFAHVDKVSVVGIGQSPEAERIAQQVLAPANAAAVASDASPGFVERENLRRNNAEAYQGR